MSFKILKWGGVVEYSNTRIKKFVRDTLKCIDKYCYFGKTTDSQKSRAKWNLHPPQEREKEGKNCYLKLTDEFENS